MKKSEKEDYLPIIKIIVLMIAVKNTKKKLFFRHINNLLAEFGYQDLISNTNICKYNLFDLRYIFSEFNCLILFCLNNKLFILKYSLIRLVESLICNYTI